jgi:hypothetical protein
MDARRDGMARGLAAANLALCLGLLVFSLGAFPRLPERYPVHFDAAGQPNRWAAGGSLEWFILPGVTVGMNALLVGLALSIRRIPPRWINLPRKRDFLKLSPELQAPILGSVSRFLLGMGLVINLLCIALQAQSYLAAAGGSLFLSPAVMVLPLVVLGVYTAVWLVALSRQVNEACRKGGAP